MSQTPDNERDSVLVDTRPTQKQPVRATGAGSGNSGKGSPWLAILLVLAIVGGGVAGFFGHRRISALEQALAKAAAERATLAHNHAKETGDLAAATVDYKTLTDSRFLAIENQQKELARQIQDLDADVGNRIAELDRKVRTLVAERITPVEEGLKELDSKLGATRAEFLKNQEANDAVVGQIKKDTDYIVEELGKKAEKAYMLFMERKLKKQIGAVGEDVEAAKTEFREGLSRTEQKVEKLGRDIERKVQSSVKKEVQKQDTIDFEPADQDEPEGEE